MFKKSMEFVTIMKKLYWTCHPNITRFGYKRRMVEFALPGLCDFYDNHFYTRTTSIYQQSESFLLSL